MIFTTEPMLLLEFGVWDIDGDVIKRKDGTVVENVALLDLEADEIHRFTIQDEGAQRPAPMTQVEATCSARTAAKGREDGSTTSKLKVRVLALKPAPGATSPAASPPDEKGAKADKT